jgi:fatty acid desaturase
MCDDRSMAVASRVKPQDLFSPEDWTRISARSSWRGLLMVAHAWGVIALAVVAGVVWPVLIPVCVMIDRHAPAGAGHPDA